MSEEKKPQQDVELDEEALEQVQGGAQMRRSDQDRIPNAPKIRIGGRPTHPG